MAWRSRLYGTVMAWMTPSKLTWPSWSSAGEPPRPGCAGPRLTAGRAAKGLSGLLPDQLSVLRGEETPAQDKQDGRR